MTILNRRRFLAASAATAATLAASRQLTGLAGGSASRVNVWTTTGTERHVAREGLSWQPLKTVSSTAVVLDPGKTRQKILGFGAALTDASCYLLSQMAEPERGALLHEFFAADQMAFNVCRTCIGASDYSRSVYSFDESASADPELKHFSIDHDRAYILPTLVNARTLNPELFLFSSPWSPPGWMKSGGSILGGAMRKPSFRAYAQYFERFLKDYAAAGIKINAVTVQNEVDTDQDGRMPACLWGQEYEMEFVAKHLGPTLEQAGLDTKIWVLDHNYNLWGRAMDELSAADAAHYIDGIAWHGYFGDASAMTRVHDAFPQKNAYWTEGGPDVFAADYQTDYTQWAATMNGVLNNWARSITAWNLVLDEKGNPNIGPFHCGGMITIDSATHQLTRSGQYWAFAHFSRHIRRGAQVFATNGVGTEQTSVSHCGFHNPDGTSVLVLANSGAEQPLQIVMADLALEIKLPANSVHTLTWS